jgi:succinoglycan biosynthesis transport protein ExoP
VVAQGLSTEAKSRQEMAAGNAGASPDVASSPLIQNLKASLSAAEAKFADVQQRLSQNHPQYIAAKAELDKLREDLRTQQNLISSSVGSNAQIMHQREQAIRAATAEQKAKVLELNRTRDEMGVLMKDVESAQRAFDAVALRSAQTKIEGQSEQTDISVLNPATPPTEHSQPKVLLNVLLAIFFGSLLGVGLGLGAEMLDRRVRSERDLLEALQIPVLGSIAWNPPKRRRFGKVKPLGRLSAN